MKLKTRHAAKRPQAGFTLIELLVVVLIIGILAAIAVPQYFKVVEKGKAAEAFAAMDALRGAQDRYLAASGNYCGGNPSAAMAGCPSWDIPPVIMKYFNIPAVMTTGGGPNWSVQITRIAPLPALYGAYTLTYAVASGAIPTFACDVAACTADLLPQ